jgi:Ca2+-binding RTX toxin-like protein
VAIDVSKLSSLTTIDFDDYNDTGTDVHVISKMNDGMTIILGDADGDADAATNTDAELDIGFAANSSSNNVTVKMENVQILKISNDDGFLDTMTINSVTGTNIIEDASELTAKKLIITGDQTLDMNTSNALATSTTIVDASAFTGILEVTASSTGTEITGGSKADIITGGAGADVISGGAGNDIIDGAGGNDTITLGAGDDEIVIDATGDGKDTIKDFVVADDFFDINSLVTDGGGYAASAETKVQTIAADADVTLGAGIVIVDNGDNDIANADSLSTTDIADRLNDLGDDNNSGAADNILSLSNKDDDFIIAISDGTDTAIVHMTGDGTNTDIAAGDLVVLAVIEGMSDAGTLTAANFDGFTAL